MEDVQRIASADVGTLVLDPGLSPDEVLYVREKLAGIGDIARVQQLRANEVAFPLWKGGRPAALAEYDARIAQLQTATTAPRASA